jgi:nucleotide-binding universal stress UspA family protein
MYKHILIATDGSELAGKAVDTGLALAKSLGAQAMIVTVSEPWSAVAVGEVAIAYPQVEYERSTAANAARILDRARQAADRLGVAVATLHVKNHFPADGILTAAKEKGCDLIVMASHGRRGLVKLLLGSQAHKVVTQGAIPVLICR